MVSISRTICPSSKESSPLQINIKRCKNKIIRPLLKPWSPMRFPLIRQWYQFSTTRSISIQFPGKLNLITVSSKYTITISFNSSYSNSKWAPKAITLLRIQFHFTIILSLSHPNHKRASTILLTSRCLKTYFPWTMNPFPDMTTICCHPSSAIRIKARLKVHTRWAPLKGRLQLLINNAMEWDQ